MCMPFSVPSDYGGQKIASVSIHVMNIEMYVIRIIHPHNFTEIDVSPDSSINIITFSFSVVYGSPID